MSPDRGYQSATHLTLALAGVCLTVAEWEYLPEMAPGLLVYLGLLYLSWRRPGRRLSDLWANVLGLLIAAGTAAWVYVRLDREGTWTEEIPLAAMLVPYLGPVVMALLLVRLFQPRTDNDFWLLQGLGLVQVALGCVLANGVLFGSLLLAYVASALASLALGEHHLQTRRATGRLEQPATPRAAGRGWFVLRWTAAVAAVGLPLFLITPRLSNAEWDPLQRFGVKPTRTTTAKTGFSEDIDLRRTGVLEVDTRMAFTVTVTDSDGRPRDDLPANQRWRGTILDSYQRGRWSSEQNWSRGAPRGRVKSALPDYGAATRHLVFRVPNKAGGLFLADPVLLGDAPGEIPVEPLFVEGQSIPLFVEGAGTVLPRTYLTDPVYSYRQVIGINRGSARHPEKARTQQLYRLLLLRQPVRALRRWTTDLLAELGQRDRYRTFDTAGAIPRAGPQPVALAPRQWEPVARLLTDYLARSGDYTYSLNRRRADETIDPVMDFLTNVKQGPCERYAAALALMLRSLGIPARVVKGFHGCDYEGAGVYVVRFSHAHAWVEALVPRPGRRDETEPPEYDWLTLDPTPDSATDESALARWLEQGRRSGQTFWNELIVGYNAAHQADLWAQVRNGELLPELAWWAAVPAGMFALIWLGRWWQRRIVRQPRADTLYTRLLALLARVGLRPEIAQTPREFAVEAGAALARLRTTGALAEVPGRLAEVYYRARYGDRPPAEEELRQMEEELRALGAALRG